MRKENSRPTAMRLKEMSVPGTGQEFHAYGFEGNPDGITFISHDVKPFIQISIDALNKHWIAVVARQNMIIDVEEIKGFLEHTHAWHIRVM
jgi:hypothetical protein